MAAEDPDAPCGSEADPPPRIGSSVRHGRQALGAAVAHPVPGGSVADLASLPLSGAARDDLAVSAANAHPFAADERDRYRDAQVVARGGMGRVSAVTDARLRRQVALKEVLPTCAAADAPGLERRLAHEAWITAQLEHPGVVPVYDAGHGDQGRPFFTMRLIRGRSLATALADADLDEPTLLRHFLAVCQAMGYAHAMGVVHRDLKPANIMLGEFGETQVVDWGLARVLGEPDPDASSGAPPTGASISDAPSELAAYTVAGSRLGTPAYMSPEQARGQPLGRPSDVWSLGAILVEIITRRPLYAGLSTAEIFVRLERGPVPRVADVAPAASPELAAIATRALRLDPAGRYPDAKHLADDVAAYLDGRRVAAFAYSAWDLVKRFGRAFRVPLTIIALALVTVGAVFAVSYDQTLTERDRAVAAERSASIALAAADRSFADLLVRGAREAALHNAQTEAELLAAHALTRGPSPEARGVLARWGPDGRSRLTHAEPAPACGGAYLSPSGRLLLCVEPSATSLWEVAPLALRWRAPTRLDRAHLVSDARAVVSGPDHERGALLDLDTGALQPLPLHVVVERVRSAAGVGLAVSLMDDGRDLVIWRDGAATATSVAASVREPRALSGDGRRAVVYDDVSARASLIDLTAASAHLLPPLPLSASGPMSAALDRVGHRAAFGSTHGELLVIDLPTATPRWRASVADRPLTHVSWSPDDRWLAVRDERGWLSLHEATAGRRLALPRLRADDLAWRASPGGLDLVVLGDELRVWRLPSAPRATRYPATAGVAALALDPAGALLALADGRGAVRVYDVVTGALAGELPGDERAVAKDVAFLHARPGLAVAWPGRFLLAEWRPGAAADAPRPLDEATNYRRVVALADGSVLTANYGESITHFRRVGPPARRVTVDRGSPIDLVASADGRVVAWLSARGAVEVAAVAGDGELEAARAVVEAPEAVAIALDALGARLAVARAGRVDVINSADGADVATHSTPGARALEVALSRDGAWVAAGMVDGAVWVWGPGGGPRMIGAGHTQRVSGIAFGPSGEWLISAGWDGVALRWDLTGLDAPAASLVPALEAAWGVGLDHATRTDLR